METTETRVRWLPDALMGQIDLARQALGGYQPTLPTAPTPNRRTGARLATQVEAQAYE